VKHYNQKWGPTISLIAAHSIVAILLRK
jgi:hypothetical protein